MPRKDILLDLFEPAITSTYSSPRRGKISTCTDFYLTNGGTLGSTTQHVRSEKLQTFQQSPARSDIRNMHQNDRIDEDRDLPIPIADDPKDELIDKDLASSKPQKKKRPPWSPLSSWLLLREVFLLEALRLEGRGDYAGSSCGICNGGDPKYRCVQCVGGELFCQECIVLIHQRNPLHSIEEWTDNSYFKRTSLKELGLVVQLNHRPGDKCPNSKSPHNLKTGFMVIDISGIHEIDLRFCECHDSPDHYVQILRYGWFPATVDRPHSASTNGVLKFFHILNFESKSSVFEFYNTLARHSDNTGTAVPTDKEDSFWIMFKEYRNIKLLKHGGRGHKFGGAAGTKKGELGLLCPACPQPGKNMGPGWQSANGTQRGENSLFLAVDGNFRLKRRVISSEEKDPGLSNGWSYYPPQAEYQAHVKKYDNRIVQKKSTCSNYKAVNQERETKGFASTGVMAVDCARHDMKRPLGVGDLHRGERLKDVSPDLDVVVSYDICCQWSQALWERMKIYRPSLQIPKKLQAHMRFLVPKFHLPSHVAKCQTKYSFNLSPNVGRTDGEAPERGWARINPIASSTTDMGPGTRRDTLDDHFGDSNWRKTTFIAASIELKLEEAEHEYADYKFLHNQFTLGLPSKQIKSWEAAMAAWGKDPSKFPNPFEKRFAFLTQEKVARMLDREEGVAKAIPKLHSEVTAVRLISMGLDHEEELRRMRLKLKRKDVSKTQRAMTKGRMDVLRTLVQEWIGIQHRYAPNVAPIRDEASRAESAKPSGNADIDLDLELYLPSSTVSITNTEGQPIYDRRILFIEYHLRGAQADDALNELRNKLRLQSYVCIDKDRFQRGQRRNTRSRSIIARLEGQVSAAATKYRIARDAISQLAPALDIVGWKKTYPFLADGDIRGYSDDELPPHMKAKLPLAKKKEAMRQTSKKARRAARQDLSWIWQRLGSHILRDDTTNEDLRIQFCKSKARVDRWGEEVRYLRREGKRVEEFFGSRSDDWRKLGDDMEVVAWAKGYDSAMKEGLKGYAMQQANMFVAMAERSAEIMKKASSSKKRYPEGPSSTNDFTG